MSRRHKEPENKEYYKPEQMESHDDGHLGEMSDKKSNKVGRHSVRNVFLSDTLYKLFSNRVMVETVDKIITKVFDAFAVQSVEVDDKWVKIPRSAFDEFGEDWLDRFRKQAYPHVEETPPESKRGAPRIKQLFSKIADSKVMKLYHKTWNNVQRKCAELVENITHFSVCFLHGSHKAFAPDDDPYRKLSHYYGMIKAEVEGFPTLRTLNNYNNWFINWTPRYFKDIPKEIKERHRHKLWEELIEWIYHFLIKVAPEYAFSTAMG